MPNTLIPIQTYTLTSTATSVTFSGIPQNYTDLKLVISARVSNSATQGILDIQFNGSSANFDLRYLGQSNTSVVSYTRASGFGTNMAGYYPAANSTASTFGNVELYFPNYSSTTASKSVFIDAVMENNSSTIQNGLVSGLWSQNSAITSLTFSETTGGNLVSGSTFTLYGVSNGVKATGGTLIVAGGYAYHTFTSTGSFLPNQRIKNAEVLCVAGGGGGGARFGGGGGAGGVLYASRQTLNAGNTYTALVGAGGTAGTTISGKQGSNSVLSSVIAIGGGAGGGSDPTTSGGLGGSGGGGMGSTESPNGGSATSGQGYAGGSGGSTTENDYRRSGGGGGGAGAVGTNVYNTGLRGDGGAGTASYSAWHAITGTGVLSSGSYYIAGGGGGGIYGSSGSTSGGTGGGGAGSRASTGGTATAGTANTGGGGGGAGGDGGTGGAGGSGLIIVRYPLS
jgi:hypothetical protein